MPNDEHWRQCPDEASAHVAGQPVGAAQKDGCAGIAGIIVGACPELFVSQTPVRVGLVCDVMVAAADDEREVTGQQPFGLGWVVEPQSCVAAQHRVE